MKKGNDLIVLANGQPLAASKSCGIDVSVETKEVALAGTGTFKHYIAGRKSWSVTTNHLVGDSARVADLLARVGQVFTLSWRMRTDTEEADRMEGSAICAQCKITATRGNLIQGSFTWKGTGAIG